MSVTTVVVIAVVVVVLLYGIIIFNSLVNVKHNVDKAWSNIDVLLKQRHDELPKLIETCRQYMQFERDTLERVIQARALVAAARERHDVGALGGAENALREGLGKLFALAESYPELKANEQFMHLHGRITNLENAIADRREFYNESVNINNVRIEQFPANIVANMFSFEPFELLKFSAEEKKDVNFSELFAAPKVKSA